MTTEGADHEHKDEEKKDEPQAEAQAEKKDEAEAEKKDEAHVEAKEEAHAETKHDDHGHGHAPAASLFTDAQVADMHASDRTAARNIVLLLMGIFVMGICIYGYVANVVARGWWG